MRVAAYLRVSSETEDSIDTQRAACADYCRRESHAIVAEYVDLGISGGLPIAERPAGRQMIEDAKARRFEGIITKQQDRLGRNAADTISFLGRARKLGVQLLFVQESFADTPAGRLSYSVLAALAQYYREDIGQKVRDHNRRRAERGQWPGGPVPFGYCLDPDSKLVQPHPGQADDLAALFRLYIESQGSRVATARELARLGIRGARGCPWTANQVARAIANPIYRGLKSYNGEEFPLDLPELLPVELVERARELLECSRGARVPSKPSQGTTYSGSLICGLCGSHFTCSHNRNGSATYCCNGRRRAYICEAPMVMSTRLDALVVPTIAEIIRSVSERVSDVAARAQPSPPRRKGRDKAAARERLLSVYVDGHIDRAVYEKKLAEIRAEEKADREAPTTPTLDPELAAAIAEDIAGFWGDLQPGERRTLVQTVTPRIIVTTGRILRARIESPYLPELVSVEMSQYRPRLRAE